MEKTDNAAAVGKGDEPAVQAAEIEARRRMQAVWMTHSSPEARDRS